MKTSAEPECKVHPHIKVKKKRLGKRTKKDKGTGTLYKGVAYEILEVSGHQRATDTHKYTAIIDIEDKNQVKFAFPVWPELKDMRKEYKLWKARRPVGPRN